VPDNYTFWDLHVAIQDAMGWQDSHLHKFSVLKDPKDVNSDELVDIGIPEIWFPDVHTIPGWSVRVRDYLTMATPRSVYEYDFGDSWEHFVDLESIVVRDKKQLYPRCLDGEKAGPPEDSGGSDGYLHLCEVLKDKKHEEYKELKEWVEEMCGRYDPERFKARDVMFKNPSKALKDELGHRFK